MSEEKKNTIMLSKDTLSAALSRVLHHDWKQTLQLHAGNQLRSKV